jgi:hypothetical protein
VQADKLRADLKALAGYDAELKVAKADQEAKNAKYANLVKEREEEAKLQRLQKHADVRLKVHHRSKHISKAKHAPPADEMVKKFRNAVLDEVKQALRRPYGKKKIDREAYKIIAAKATDKVVHAISRVRPFLACARSRWSPCCSHGRCKLQEDPGKKDVH